MTNTVILHTPTVFHCSPADSENMNTYIYEGQVWFLWLPESLGKSTETELKGNRLHLISLRFCCVAVIFLQVRGLWNYGNGPDFSKKKTYILVLLNFFVLYYSSAFYFRKVLENTKILPMGKNCLKPLLGLLGFECFSSPPQKWFSS